MVESESASDSVACSCLTFSALYINEGATCSGVITELLNG